MNPKRVLRWLIVVELMLGLVHVAVAYWSIRFLPPPLQNYVNAQAEAEMGWDDWVIGGLVLQMIPLLLLSYIGLWRAWRFARVLYLCVGVLAICCMVLLGPSVTTGWAAAIDGLSWTVSGLILGLIYFSPLKDSFARPRASE